MQWVGGLPPSANGMIIFVENFQVIYQERKKNNKKASK
jgi:hypothetical protein